MFIEKYTIYSMILLCNKTTHTQKITRRKYTYLLTPDSREARAPGLGLQCIWEPGSTLPWAYVEGRRFLTMGCGRSSHGRKGIPTRISTTHLGSLRDSKCSSPLPHKRRQRHKELHHDHYLHQNISLNTEVSCKIRQ